MEAVHGETRRILLEARTQLESLEHASGQTGLDPAASAAVQDAYRASLHALSQKTESLRKQAGRKAVWVARVRDLDDQMAELRTADARIAMRFRQIRTEAQMREQLLQRTGAAPGDAVIGLGPIDEARSLERVGGGAAGILATGQGALEALLGQRKRLKGAKRKMMDVMHQMGVDRKIIAQIERRDLQDKHLLYICMALLIFLLLCAVWLKSHWSHRP